MDASLVASLVMALPGILLIQYAWPPPSASLSRGPSFERARNLPKGLPNNHTECVTGSYRSVKFEPPLQRATLIRRYKRFLADVETAAGETLTLHCPNTGAMTGCADPGSVAWYSTSTNERRKYPHTLEVVEDRDGHFIGINSARANELVAEALEADLLPGFPKNARVQREVVIPGQPGRLDLLVDDIYVEVKSVTLKLADSGAFPDAVSVRAARHLDTLSRLARKGGGAALVFCVLRSAFGHLHGSQRRRDRSRLRARPATRGGRRRSGMRPALSRHAVGSRAGGGCAGGPSSQGRPTFQRWLATPISLPFRVTDIEVRGGNA